MSDMAREFTGTAYSGGIVTDHWMFDAIIFDTQSIRFDQEVPILLNHDSDKPAGVAEPYKEGNAVKLKGRVFSQDVINAADNGFPWQMSVGLFGGTLRKAENGETVNGILMNGGEYVVENARIREVSFTPVGADANTEAKIAASADIDEMIESGRLDRLFIRCDAGLSDAGLIDAGIAKNSEKPVENGDKTMEKHEFDAMIAEKDAKIAELESKMAELETELAAVQACAEKGVPAESIGIIKAAVKGGMSVDEAIAGIMASGVKQQASAPVQVDEQPVQDTSIQAKAHDVLMSIVKQ